MTYRPPLKAVAGVREARRPPESPAAVLRLVRRQTSLDVVCPGFPRLLMTPSSLRATRQTQRPRERQSCYPFLVPSSLGPESGYVCVAETGEIGEKPENEEKSRKPNKSAKVAGVHTLANSITRYDGWLLAWVITFIVGEGSPARLDPFGLKLLGDTLTP